MSVFKRFPVFFILLILYSCNKKGGFVPQIEKGIELNALMDTLLPYFAKLHDSIQESGRFDTQNKEYYAQHAADRRYKWLKYYVGDSGYCYFIISRLEPSVAP
jgi:hypothetical protein